MIRYCTGLRLPESTNNQPGGVISTSFIHGTSRKNCFALCSQTNKRQRKVCSAARGTPTNSNDGEGVGGRRCQRERDAVTGEGRSVPQVRLMSDRSFCISVVAALTNPLDFESNKKGRLPHNNHCIAFQSSRAPAPAPARTNFIRRTFEGFSLPWCVIVHPLEKHSEVGHRISQSLWIRAWHLAKRSYYRRRLNT